LTRLDECTSEIRSIGELNPVGEVFMASLRWNTVY